MQVNRVKFTFLPIQMILTKKEAKKWKKQTWERMRMLQIVVSLFLLLPI